MAQGVIVAPGQNGQNGQNPGSGDLPPVPGKDFSAAMATIGTLLYTWFYGRHVGRDSFGNQYYRRRASRRRRANNGREERWVLYKGSAEASRVPGEWHGWLHHMVEKPPTESPAHAPSWARPHEMNPTGTAEAYHPAGHVLEGGVRSPATGDYEAWTPRA